MSRQFHYSSKPRLQFAVPENPIVGGGGGGGGVSIICGRKPRTYIYRKLWRGGGGGGGS